MAEQDRKKSGGKSSGKGKQPISRHPLFPATVALWFGALFGLGSLAIRPTLLESIVLAGHIDTLVPAAAPPLGMTARILLALVMSGIGGMGGAVVARRLARPRPEPRERRRGAVHASGRADSQEGRRRALAVETDYTRPDFDERAPLPGGAPQILDVSDFDFDAPEAEPALRETVVSHRQQEPDSRPTLDLSSFAREGAPPQEVRLRPAHGGHAVISPAMDEPAPPAAPAAPVRPFDAPADDEPRQVFPVRAQPAPAPLEEEGLPERYEGLARMSPPLFGEQAGRNAADKEAPRLFERHAPPSAAPLAEPLADLVADPVAAAPFAPPIAAPLAAVPAAVPAAPFAASPAAEFTAPLAAEVSPFAAPQPVAAQVATSAPTAARAPAASFAPPAGSAAERLTSANLAELSPVELIERLALSLQARREKATPAEPALQAAPAEMLMPAAFAAPQAPIGAPVPVMAAAATAPATASAIAPDAAETPVLPPLIRIPAALRPVGLDHLDEDEDSLPGFVPLRHIAFPPPAPAAPAAAAEPVASAPAPIPAAGTDAGDAGMLETSAFEDGAFEDSAFDAAPFDACEADDPLDSESQALEEGYSSLLDLTRKPQPRQSFVRIEEPEAADAPVESVVVFPGQESVHGTAFGAPAAAAPFAAPAAHLPAAVPAARPFDAPGSASATLQAIAVPAQDPEETDRALRSALATLQRMSGAA